MPLPIYSHRREGVRANRHRPQRLVGWVGQSRQGEAVHEQRHLLQRDGIGGTGSHDDLLRRRGKLWRDPVVAALVGAGFYNARARSNR